MAGKGNTTPKDPATRRRRNSKPTTEVVADEVVRGDDLPAGIEWPPETRIWWHNWRRAPQSKVFTPTDWDFLLDTALLHAKLWGAMDTSVLPELRLRVAKLGATHQDRKDMSIKVETPSADPRPGGGPSGRYGHLKSVSA